MKLWLGAILLLAGLPGLTQVVRFDRTQINTDIISVRTETLPGIQVYAFTPLIVFQGRIVAIPGVTSSTNTPEKEAKGIIKMVSTSNTIISQFTPISFANITPFTPMTFTPLQ